MLNHGTAFNIKIDSHHHTDGSMACLVSIFHEIDVDDNGIIELEELKSYLLAVRAKNSKQNKLDFITIAASVAGAVTMTAAVGYLWLYASAKPKK